MQEFDCRLGTCRDTVGIANITHGSMTSLKRHSYPSSSSIMAPFFAGNSCDPFTPQALPCTLGNEINYAIDVAVPADVAAGIAFATKHNVRLVIRNTGHE